MVHDKENDCGKRGETLCCYFSVLVALDEDALSIASYTTNGEETQSAQTYINIYIHTHVIQNNLRTHPAGGFAASRVG